MNKDELQNLLDQEETADLFPVVCSLPADLVTPLGTYLAVSKDASTSFLFESVEGGEQIARFSFIGANPQKVIRPTRSQKTTECIRQELDDLKVADVPGLPAFAGGVVATIDFDFVSEVEPSIESDKTKQRTALYVYDQVIAFDHAKQRVLIIRQVRKESGTDLSQSILETYSELEAIGRNLFFAIGELGLETKESASNPITSNWKREDFEKGVREIKEGILDGSFYQVVLSQRFQRKTDASPVSVYRALRSLNPSPYMFLIMDEGTDIVGASPEMLVRHHESRLEYRPIAGTRPRGLNPSEDETLAEEMREDKKEVSEHVMLVDLGRNDLGRVSEYGSVNVSGLMAVEKFSHVQHLVSYLNSSLSPEISPIDAFAACFPAGTVSGAPKISAIKEIKRLEPTPRGLYSGAVGYFGYDGSFDTCIAIRTMVIEDGVATVQAGAGIVADSVPGLEFEETEHKAAGLFAALDLAESGTY